MKYIIFLALALIEYLFITIITNHIVKIQDYVSINYNTFRFMPIGKKNCGLNILIKMLVPIIYTIICSGIFYKTNSINLVSQIYIIDIFYFIIRWIIIIFVYDRKELIDWKSEVVIFIANIIIMLYLYHYFILKTTDIFIPINEIKNAVWIGIITFTFIIVRNYIYYYIKVDEIKLKKRKDMYILKKYIYLKTKYDCIFENEEKNLKKIVYAIMIYENYNRPFIIRIIEYIKFIFTRNATLGIMQYKTNKLITNWQSIEKGVNKIKKSYIQYNEKLKNNDDIFKNIVLDYNNSIQYYEEVKYISEVINSI